MFCSPESQGGFGFDGPAGGSPEEFATPGFPGYQAFLRSIPLLRGQHVLHLSCGAGTLTERIAASVGADGLVVAVDSSREMLERAAARSSSKPWVTFRQGHLIPSDLLSGVFDHVVLEENPFRFEETGTIFRDLSRALRSDGRLWIRHPRLQSGVVEGRPYATALRSELARAGLVMLHHYEDADGFFAQAIKVTN